MSCSLISRILRYEIAADTNGSDRPRKYIGAVSANCNMLNAKYVLTVTQPNYSTNISKYTRCLGSMKHKVAVRPVDTDACDVSFSPLPREPHPSRTYLV